jgi:hypothetical protein
MAYYDRFRGDFDQTIADIEKRRQALIDDARSRQPENIDELLASAKDGELDHDLEWVKVPNPWHPEKGDTITVRPILSLSSGNADPEREKDHTDKGVWGLGVEARLPDGEAWYMGYIMFFYNDGRPKFEPDISVNMSAEDAASLTEVPWESADAQLLMTVAQDALAHQPQASLTD